MSKITVFGIKEIEGKALLDKQKPITVSDPETKQSFEGWSGKIQTQELIYFNNSDSYSADHSVKRLNALKRDGITHILNLTTCGSLHIEIETGEYTAFHQLIDFTETSRTSLIQDLAQGKDMTNALAQPFSDDLRGLLVEAAILNGITIHNKCTLMAVSAPRSTTFAESSLYRKWNADVINDTTAVEAIAAKALGLEYAAIALCTDYDTWRSDAPPVTASEIQDNIQNALDTSIKLLKAAIINFNNI